MMLAQTERDSSNLEQLTYGATISGPTFRYMVTNV